MKLIKERIRISTIQMKHRTSVHIAIVVKGNKVMEVAGNMIGSRSKGCGYDNSSIHAERAVLKKIGDVNKLNGAVMAVVRIAKGTGDTTISKPCHSCQCHLNKCIKKYGLKSVYYSV